MRLKALKRSVLQEIELYNQNSKQMCISMDSVALKQFVTKIKTVKESFEWKIENFLLNNKKTGESFQSPSFILDKNNKIKWHIRVYPKGDKENNKEYVSVFLNAETEGANNSIEFQFSIINKNKMKKHIANILYHFKGSVEGYGPAMFIKTDVLKANKETLLPEGILTLCCDMDVGFNEETYKISTNQTKSFELYETYKRQVQTCEDLYNLLQKQELTDTVLITCNKELRVHKTVLAARSPVFLAMLTNNMVEKIQNEIKVTDFDSEVVSEMLEFMYTGKVKNVEKNGVDLLRIADKYQVMGLKNMCENFFCSIISTENACDLLILADQYHSEDFKINVIKFILSHKKEIISTPQFLDLKAKNPVLLADLFCADC